MAVSICQGYGCALGLGSRRRQIWTGIAISPTTIRYVFESKDMKRAGIVCLSYPDQPVPAVPLILGHEPGNAGLTGPHVERLVHGLT